MKIPDNAIRALKSGGIGVMPTDTIYGIVCKALDKKAVTRVYELKRRDPHMPFIILIDSLNTLPKIGIKIEKQKKVLLEKIWSTAPASVILPCFDEKFAYLHRGRKTLAIRQPSPRWLRSLLKKTGPLIATSANLHGQPVAKTTKQAKKTFADNIDFYLNGGKLASKASSILQITVLR